MNLLSRRICALAGAVLLALTSAYAADGALWMRYPSISPDGKTIAFSYQGSIYTVPATGGKATRLTLGDDYCYMPVWSPDGREIAYACDAFGAFDIFTIPSAGGPSARVTLHSASEYPYAYSPDGQKIYYSAAIGQNALSAVTGAARLGELYRIDRKGGRPERVTPTPAEEISFAPDGKSFVYQDRKGSENNWRKHQTSSVARDIWSCDLESGVHTMLTRDVHDDRMPRYSADGSTIYFLSERSGSFNVWEMKGGNEASARQLTNFDTHPVRFLSAALDGTLCFGYNGGIYTYDSKRGTRKVDIEIQDTGIPGKKEFLNVSGGNEYVISPDGKEVAFTYRGDVFVTSSEYATTKQVSATPQTEKGLTFSKDGRKLYYASERDGMWDIYVSSLVRDADPGFANATLLREERFFGDREHERTCPDISPDGKKLAFVQDRDKLMVMDLASGAVTMVTDGSKHYSTTGSMDYSWSPDSKWFALSYTANGHDPYSDIAIVSAAGGEIINLTRTGYFDMAPVWSADGNVILFATDRYGMRSHASWGSLEDVMAIFLNRKAYDEFCMSEEEKELHDKAEKDRKEKEDAAKEEGKDKKKKKDTAEEEAPKDGVKDIAVETDRIEERIVRLTPISGSLSSYTLDKEGKTLYYIATYGRQSEMFKCDFRKGSSPKKIQDIDGSLAWDSKYENLFIFGRGISRMKGGNGSPESVAVSARLEYDPAAERAYLYDHIWKQEKERFYSVDLHGVDWVLMGDNYRQFLPSIDNDYDFAELASELLGELNVSHTGAMYRPSSETGDDATAELGLFFADDFGGDGLLVEEVVDGGPFDKAASKVASGDLLLAIDGEEIIAGEDWYHMLNRKAGKKVLCSFRKADGSAFEEIVTPVSISAMRSLLYRRWVKNNARMVEELSGGRLGYVHIESMDDESYRTIYADILGKYYHCDGIVIDTRYNGGGRLHEDIEILFSGTKYLTQVVRGKEACDMPSRRWNKASIMVTGEYNYSNAHGTPWVYQHMGIGSVVGMPVPGTMTSVNWEYTQNPDLVFGIPVVGYRKADGGYLENCQLEPDYKVANTTETLSEGRDLQLEKAVEILLRQIDGKE